MTQQWDNTFNPGAYSLSMSGREAQSIQNSTPNEQLICTEFKTSGKWYWEWNFNYAGAVPMFVGLANASTSPSVFCGGDANSIGWKNDGTGSIWNNNADTGAVGGSWALGPDPDNLCCALDMDNNKFWMRPDPSVKWNNSNTANPATNTGGWTLLIHANPVTIACSFQQHGFPYCILNLTPASWAGTAPAGFLDWDHVFTPKVDHDVAQRVMRGIMRGVMQPVVP